MGELPSGWLSPMGELYECKYYEHAAKAEEICDKLNVSYERRWKGCDEALYTLGWCKLAMTLLKNKEYWVHWERPLTAYQRHFLKEYFENNGELKFPMNCTSLAMYFYEDDFFGKEGGE